MHRDAKLRAEFRFHRETTLTDEEPFQPSRKQRPCNVQMCVSHLHDPCVQRAYLHHVYNTVCTVGDRLERDIKLGGELRPSQASTTS